VTNFIKRIISIFLNFIIKMEHYIAQLIADILSAQRPNTMLSPVSQEKAFESHIAAVERYISGEGHEPIRTILGLDEIQFSPVERLNDEQMSNVISAFEKFLSSWNICLDLPENLPISLQYELYINTLDKCVAILDFGTIHLEVCSYCPDECTLGEYCQCKDYKFDPLEDSHVNDTTIGELPF
jgi:hypothetical protein